jgi:hypothetical protein
MRKTQLEIADPAAWLRHLADDRDGFSRLVGESKGMARAAYRLARAHCSIETRGTPSLQDLQEATTWLAARLGVSTALPIQSVLPAAVEAARSVPPPAPSSLHRAKSRPEASRVSL